MSKHTPGPWTAVGKSVRTAATFGRKEDAPNGYQGGICNCFGGTFGDKEQDEIAKANARLIAAAPSMLEACEAANDHFSRFLREGVDLEEYPIILKLRVAIAKARGESVSSATSEGKSE